MERSTTKATRATATRMNTKNRRLELEEDVTYTMYLFPFAFSLFSEAGAILTLGFPVKERKMISFSPSTLVLPNLARVFTVMHSADRFQ